VDVVRTLAEIEENLLRLDAYLASADLDERDFARALVRRGRCFVVAHRYDGGLFGPSRFVGYRQNSRAAHAANDDKDGRETNPAITAIFGPRMEDAELEEEYRLFCQRVGIEYRDISGMRIRRWYWPLD
jgi:hypothetical protein